MTAPTAAPGAFEGILHTDETVVLYGHRVGPRTLLDCILDELNAVDLETGSEGS